jgi:hypothetical protein
VLNISGLPPHKKGWANPPDPSERSVSANIDRVREMRIKYIRISLSDTEFQNVWLDLTTIIGELEASLPGGCTMYTEAANLIKTDIIYQGYLRSIDEQHQSLEEIKGNIF